MGRALVWVFRGAWAALPLTAGPGFASALDAASRPVQLTAAIGLWAGWAFGVLLSLLPATTSLTLLRTLVPAAPVAASAAVVADARTSTAVGLVATLLPAVLVASAEVGQVFVQGSAYGREVRFLLRPPTALLLGPLELAWLLTVGALGSGALLLAAGHWAWAAALLLVGALLVVPVVRRFHGLSRRWLVFVPAGLVLHDHLVLAETALIPGPVLDGVRLAAPDGVAADLTAGAGGRTLELRFGRPQSFQVAAPGRRRAPRPLQAERIVVAPSRPGAVVAAAHDRR